MIALGMMDESRHIRKRTFDRWILGADSGSVNVHGVLRTLYGCNSLNSMRLELGFWHVIALGMIDECYHMNREYKVVQFWVLDHRRYMSTIIYYRHLRSWSTQGSSRLYLCHNRIWLRRAVGDSCSARSRSCRDLSFDTTNTTSSTTTTISSSAAA
mgnify:CR=1 FL=1